MIMKVKLCTSLIVSEKVIIHKIHMQRGRASFNESGVAAAFGLCIARGKMCMRKASDTDTAVCELGE